MELPLMYVPNDILAKIFDNSDDLTKHVLPHVCVAFHNIATAAGIKPVCICTTTDDCRCIECISAQWPFTDVDPYHYDMCLHAAVEDCFDILQWALSVGYAFDENIAYFAICNGNLEMTRWAVEHGCYLCDEMIIQAVHQNCTDIVVMWVDQNHNCLTPAVMYAIIECGNLELLKYARSLGFTFEDNEDDDEDFDYSDYNDYIDYYEIDLNQCTVECFDVMIEMGYKVKEIIICIMCDYPEEIIWLRRYYLASTPSFETAVRYILMTNRVDEIRWIYEYHPDRLKWLLNGDGADIVMYCQQESSADIFAWIIDHVGDQVLLELKRVMKLNWRMRWMISILYAKLYR